jgi:predicted nucleic-acid-binding Zn-ribbon protein
MYPPAARLSEEGQRIVQQALAELRRRGVNNDYCPRCNTPNWNVDLLGIPSTSLYSTGYGPVGFPRRQPTGYLPVMAIACTNCGYTVLHNLNVLGITLV